MRSLVIDDPNARVSVVLGALGRIADVEHESLDAVLATIAASAARTLRVPRVNIWLYDEERTQIVCIQEYCDGTGERQLGHALKSERYPRYFEALEQLRSVTAIDAEGDLRTSELLADYLLPNGIGSMLDVPLLQSGRVIGVVCHEHVGPARPFGAWERAFAGSIGDMVALALETERRVNAEQERSRLVERLARLRGVESLGFLAAGVAHDFRNLLTVVTASAEALHSDRGNDDQPYEDIQLAVQRAKDLCDMLLTYAGHAPQSKQRVSLGGIVSELSRLLRVRLPDQSSLELDLDATAPPVQGDATALRQVVLNLIVNAFDALGPRGGRVMLRLRSTPPPAGVVFDFRRGAPLFVLFEVEDDGVGMSPETLTRIFDPFFSTKPDGHGFGLASVLGIVRGHEGAIEVDSSIGRGTTLRVWIPAISERSSA